MDLRRLEIFIKLMETGSFSKTAREFNLTQPTISGHIKSLEQQIGLALFDRDRRRVKPTDAASVLITYANRITDLSREASVALEQFRGRISGKMTLGGSTIPGTYILPEIISLFQRKYPDTFMTLLLGDTESVIEKVTQDRIDVGLVGDRPDRSDLDFEAVTVDQMVLIVPGDAPWMNSKDDVAVRDLLKLPFVMREEGSGTRRAMLKALAGHGISERDLNVVAELGSTEAIRQAVKSGLGVSILSNLAVKEDLAGGRIRMLNIKDLKLDRPFTWSNGGTKPERPCLQLFWFFFKISAERAKRKYLRTMSNKTELTRSVRAAG